MKKLYIKPGLTPVKIEVPQMICASLKGVKLYTDDLEDEEDDIYTSDAL